MGIPLNSHIVFQAYGSEGILHECAFALLSLSRQHTKEELENVAIWIYTDNPDFFMSFNDCWLPLNFRELNPELIKQWRGTIDFVHRVKIEILRDFTKVRQGQVLYLDTDVVFVQPVTEIFEAIAEGRTVMHVLEDFIHSSDNTIFQKLSRFLKTNRQLETGGGVGDVPDHPVMWNAGVLGFHTQYTHLLEDVLDFTDSVYKKFPKHIVEQFAFSLYFGKIAPMMTAHTRISHYWNLKELRFVLASFFRFFQANTWDEVVRYSTLIQLPELMQQKINFLQNRTFPEKLAKKQWSPQEPDWDLLIKQF